MKHGSNHERLEGLQAVADELDRDDRLRLLAMSCRYRVLGFRWRAKKMLDRFLRRAVNWKRDDKRQACCRLLTLNERLPPVTPLITPAIRRRLILPTLKAWLSDEPDDLRIARWYGIMAGDKALLEQSLEQDPRDTASRRRLIESLLSDVKRATHYVSEDVFIGEAEQAGNDLAYVQSLLDTSDDVGLAESFAPEFGKLRSLVDDWQAYQRSGSTSFKQWCAEHRKSRAMELEHL